MTTETTDPSSEIISEQMVDRVLVITIDDGRANALSFGLIDELGAALQRAASNDAVGAVVLAGRPGRFSAGFDLSVIQSGDPTAVERLLAAGGQLVHDIYASGLPVVAACTGHALAAGALLMLACDYRVGPDAAVKIGLNETAIGLALPGWAVAIAQDRLSRRHLQHAVALAHLGDGQGAVAMGYLDEVVEADKVVETAITHAIHFAALDTRSYAVTAKRLRTTTLQAMTADLQSNPAARAGHTR